MHDVYPKFIIESGDLIISKVTYHKDMVEDKSKVAGGGWFKFNKDHSMMIFYGDSTDFGKAKFDDIKACVEAGNIFSDAYRINCIAEEFKFGYDNGSEIIPLN